MLSVSFSRKGAVCKPLHVYQRERLALGVEPHSPLSLTGLAERVDGHGRLLHHIVKTQVAELLSGIERAVKNLPFSADALCGPRSVLGDVNIAVVVLKNLVRSDLKPAVLDVLALLCIGKQVNELRIDRASGDELTATSDTLVG